jgi:bifunctional non-homologous end joining protein LigD
LEKVEERGFEPLGHGAQRKPEVSGCCRARCLYECELRHYGYAGSGFSEKDLKDAVERMKPLLTEKCPFANPPDIKEQIQWVRPKLVCEVEYAELTADDQLRQTTFPGWRDDKKAKEVVLERSQKA